MNYVHIRRNRYLQSFAVAMLFSALFHAATLVVAPLMQVKKIAIVPNQIINLRFGDIEGADGAAGGNIETETAAKNKQSKSLVAAEQSTASESSADNREQNANDDYYKKSVAKPVSEKPFMQYPAPAVPAPKKSGSFISVKNGNGETQSAQLGNPEGHGDEELTRYEQMLSIWFQKYRVTPASGITASTDVLLRIRIDRSGEVIYSDIEESSGISEIDNAALRMVKRGNPVPPVPANYQGKYFEFLLPVSFRSK